MDVKEAILTRRSIRAFTPQPVPNEILQEIVRVAAWSPSGYNIQPWYLHIVTGKTLENLKSALLERYKTDPEGKPEVAFYDLGEQHKERRKQVGMRIMDAKGIARDDKVKRAEWTAQMYKFFDAPSVIIISTDRRLGSMALCDLGVISMSLMLMIHSYGLGTCPEGIAAAYPDVMRKLLGIPEEQLILLALPVGYPDTNAPVNKFERQREPVEKFVQWRK
jgi:nitroreductase